MGPREALRRLRGGGQNKVVAPPCLATCIGNALMAYWGAGKSWGTPNFIGWMVQDPRLPVYAHVARQAIEVVEATAITSDPDFWKEIRRLKRRLDRFESPPSTVEDTKLPT